MHGLRRRRLRRLGRRRRRRRRLGRRLLRRRRLDAAASFSAYVTYSLSRLASLRLGVTNLSVTPQKRPAPSDSFAWWRRRRCERSTCRWRRRRRPRDDGAVLGRQRVEAGVTACAPIAAPTVPRNLARSAASVGGSVLRDRRAHSAARARATSSRRASPAARPPRRRGRRSSPPRRASASGWSTRRRRTPGA